jgi:hypothetical protein
MAALLLPSSRPWWEYCSGDIRYPLDRYRALARGTGFQPLTEDDITGNTLPTYSVVRKLPWLGVDTALAISGLLTLDSVTRLGLLCSRLFFLRAGLR